MTTDIQSMSEEELKEAVKVAFKVSVENKGELAQTDKVYETEIGAKWLQTFVDGVKEGAFTLQDIEGPKL